MKKVIRRGVFETNSSSTHSISILTKKEYDRWKNEELLLGEDNKVYTREEAIEKLKSDKYYYNSNFEDEEIVQDLIDGNFDTYEDYGEDYEEFYEEYKTPSGDEIVAFGYYGNDY